MGKKIVLILTVLLLSICSLSVPVAASGTMLNLSATTAAVGETVTASGTSDADTWIAVKVLDGTGNILLLDFVKSETDGSYSCTFTVPAVQSGILRVIGGYGSNVAKAEFTVGGYYYSVTCDGNGGTGTAPTESNKAAGATFTAANNTFTPPSGKKFKHWYTNPIGTGGTSYAQGATVTMPSGDLILYAIWEDETVSFKQNHLEVTTLAGGVVKLNGDPTPLSAVYSLQHLMGTAIRLEAVANAGYTFAYWLNVRNSSIISTDPVYEAIMGSGINVTAVFSKIPAAEDTYYTVTFKDKSGRILQSTNIAKNGTVTPPGAPSLFGYSFTQWSNPSSNVTSDMLITAKYIREADTYTVTVEGGTLSTGGNEGSYRFDMPVEVTAGVAPDGQKFSHWTQDGKKVSSKDTFTFFAPMKNTTLTAVFVPSATIIANEPFITLSADVMKDTQNGTLMFTAIKDVPDDYTLVEGGVLLLKSPTSVTELTVDTENVILGKILDTSTDQFYIMKSNVATGDTWFARAYLIYTDGNGNTFTAYSDNIVSETGGE